MKIMKSIANRSYILAAGVLLGLLLVFLSGCASDENAVSDNSNEIEPDTVITPVSEPDAKDPVLELFDQDGFVSNEKAYATTQVEWHELLGEPPYAGSTYYEDYFAECYLYVSSDGSWGHYLEFDYDNMLDDDALAEATPELIRMTALSSYDGEDVSELTYETAVSGSMLSLNKLLFGKSVETMVERLGQPLSADMNPWGYAAWSIENYKFEVYLDGDCNVLTVMRESVLENAIMSGVEPDDADFGGFGGDDGFSVDSEESDGLDDMSSVGASVDISQFAR